MGYGLECPVHSPCSRLSDSSGKTQHCHSGTSGHKDEQFQSLVLTSLEKAFVPPQPRVKDGDREAVLTACV